MEKRRNLIVYPIPLSGRSNAFSRRFFVFPHIVSFQFRQGRYTAFHGRRSGNSNEGEYIQVEKRMNISAGNLLTSLAEIVIGILLLINPVALTSTIIVLFGVALTFLGLREMIRYFRCTPEDAARQNDFAKGILFVLLGLFCLFRSQWFIATFPLLTVLYGIVNLVFGIHKLQWSIDMLRQKRRYWFTAMIGAVLTLVFAVIVLLNPFASTTVLWRFVAISLIAEALVDAVAYFMGRK